MGQLSLKSPSVIFGHHRNPSASFLAGDPISYREAIFFEVHRKHLAERDFLMRLLEDDSFTSVIDEARLQPRPDRQARLVQLEAERMQVDLLSSGERIYFLSFKMRECVSTLLIKSKTVVRIY